MDNLVTNQYIQILNEELVPALGCTEPIAIAYAAAKAREVLGKEASQIEVYCSGNMIKNARCVTIPNTHCLSGIEASALVGMVKGDVSAGLQVISNLDEESVAHARELLNQGICHVHHLKTDSPLHILIELIADNHHAWVEIKDMHTNIVKVTLDDETLFEINDEHQHSSEHVDRKILSVDAIYHFAKEVDLALIQPLLDQQIKCNLAISEEGLKGNYGVGLGKMLLEEFMDAPLLTKCKAYAAAASEARMGGCAMPVITNSGSGNQGMTTSVPLIVYAQAKGYSMEQLHRALVFSNLLTIHQKTSIGRLSAFCGAVSAACSSGAAFTFIEEGSLKQVEMTIHNTLANIPGIVCDGAKVSCAAKIATCLDAAFMSHLLALKNKCYKCDEGIIKKSIEDTISAVGRIGRIGMKRCDDEILDIILTK